MKRGAVATAVLTGVVVLGATLMQNVGTGFGPVKTIALTAFPKPSSPLTVCKGTVVTLKATLSDGLDGVVVAFLKDGNDWKEDTTENGGIATVDFLTANHAAGTYVFQAKEYVDGYGVSNEVEVNVCEFTTVQVMGNNAGGQATVAAWMTPIQRISQARVLVSGQTHSTVGPLTGGGVGLSLDQNVLSFTGKTNLRTEADIVGRTCSHAFNCTPSPSTSTDRELLFFYFLGEGLGLIGFPSRLDAKSVAFNWSITSSGWTSVVPDQYLYDDAAFVLMHCGAALGKADSCRISGTMAWTPSGPTVSLGAGRFTYLIGANDRYVAGEPGTNWWFKPGQGSGTATMGVVVGTPQGFVPGVAINNELEVTFP